MNLKFLQGGLILLLNFGSVMSHAAIKDIQTSHPPNIIILFCDDLGYGDLSIYGHPSIQTPNLDRMANEGMKFTNFYAASPKCTASRYSLLTGRLPIRSGFGAVLGPNSKLGIHTKEITLAEGLKKAEYTSAIFGKWHLGHHHQYLPLQHGFDEYVGLPYSNDMGKQKPIPLLQGNDTLELNPDQSKLTALYTERAVEFIHRNKEHPFFLYLPYTMPHVPLHPGLPFKGKSKRGTYGDTVEEIDWSVGEIMKVLKTLGLDDNTLVFFSSDNGPWLTKKEDGGSAGLLRGGKGSTWEGGMRVPGIAWWPGTIPGGKLQTNAANTMDLYVSFFKLAKLSIPTDRTIDGRDILPLLLEETILEPSSFFYYPPRNAVQAVRKGSWKLHTAISGKNEMAEFEDQLPLLFNLDIDPSEKYNVAGKNPGIVKELLAELESHMKQVNEEPTFHDYQQTTSK